jgi:hypothetical protein
MGSFEIPEQLKDCRFCRVEYMNKKPFEINWNNKPYTYQEIQNYFPAENYGVLTGINSLGVLDDDTPDKILLKLAIDNFEETFRTRDHLYFKFKGWNGQKVIFYDKQGVHCGELQGSGQMVVGAGSTHPSGELYHIKNNVPIKEIDFEIFKALFEDYLKEKKETIKEFVRTNYLGDRIQDIPLTNIISLAGLKDMGGGCFQGSHIIHGSDGGMNFRVNINQNNWYCFRCASGGGAAELIAIVEGIKRCDEIRARCFSEEDGRKIINIAREKYGLKSPVKILEPRGWACSINIKRMAERFNLLNCPSCNYPFNFNEIIGSYKCLGCGDFGNLKQFAQLALIKLNSIQKQ